MFGHILVPLDGSSLAEVVLPHVVALARAGTSKITLLQVLDPLSGVTRPRSTDPFDWQIRKAEAETYLRGVAQRLEDANLPIQMAIIEGKAAESVIEYADNEKADVIAMSSHGQSGISSWNVSSVVQKVIERVRKSVMIVRAYQPLSIGLTDLQYKRILIPLDGSQRAEVVLPAATNLARAHEAELRIVHVVERPQIPHRMPVSQEENELVDRLVEHRQVDASRYMNDLQTRINMNVSTSILVSEVVTAELHNIVDEEQPDLIMFSAHGYSGQTRWPYGSVVVSFITYGKTPLFIVQDLPEDRIEPTHAEIAAREQGGR